MHRVNLPDILASLVKAHGGEMLIRWYYGPEWSGTAITRDPQELASWTFDHFTGDFPVNLLCADDAWLSDGRRFWAVASLNMSPAQARQLLRRPHISENERWTAETVLFWEAEGQARYTRIGNSRGWYFYMMMDIIWFPDELVEIWEGVEIEGIEIRPSNLRQVVKYGRRYIEHLVARGRFRWLV